MADISLVIDRTKNIFAFAPLNAMTTKWLEKNKKDLGLLNIEGALVSEEATLLEKIKTIMDNDFSIEVWNKTDLIKIPETTKEL